VLISCFLDGFFDAGMLLSALKAKEEEEVPNDDQRDVIKRNIGRRLKLAEY
jgi:carnitine O-acetyltransferase